MSRTTIDQLTNEVLAVRLTAGAGTLAAVLDAEIHRPTSTAFCRRQRRRWAGTAQPNEERTAVRLTPRDSLAA